jgi:tetratricopeptide (TPR) repeat protein
MDFSKQLQKADEAVRRRNFDFAIELYRQLLDIEPDQGEARGGLRQALKKRHEMKKGGSRLLNAIGGAAPLAMAKTLRKAGKHEAAAKSLENYLAVSPLDEDANLLLGQSLEEAGFFRSALAVYEFLAEIAPKRAEGLKRAGAMSARHGDHQKALEYYERALQADPRDQEAIKARKDLSAERALSQSGSDRVQHSREQIKDKDEAKSLERAQRMHLSEADLREELARLEARYAEGPDPDVMISMADVHARLDDPETALEWAGRALSYRKDSFELATRVGDLRLKSLKKRIAQAGKTGDEAQAEKLEAELRALEIEEARRRVAQRPGDPALRLQLGRRLARAGDHDGAISELQKAVSDPRSQREAHILLAQCFREKGFLDLARRELERALEGIQGVDDRAKEILYNLGAIAESESKTAEARAFYARIFEVDIGYRDVASRMERFR